MPSPWPGHGTTELERPSWRAAEFQIGDRQRETDASRGVAYNTNTGNDTSDTGSTRNSTKTSDTGSTGGTGSTRKHNGSSCDDDIESTRVITSGPNVGKSRRWAQTNRLRSQMGTSRLY